MIDLHTHKSYSDGTWGLSEQIVNFQCLLILAFTIKMYKNVVSLMLVICMVLVGLIGCQDNEIQAESY